MPSFSILTDPLPRAANHKISEKNYELTNDFQIDISDANGRLIPIGITAGYRWDGSSIPRIAWSLIGIHSDSFREPSLIHDYLYEKQGQLPGLQLSRKEVDRLFINVMRSYGLPWKVIRPVHTAVRLFGGKRWKSRG